MVNPGAFRGLRKEFLMAEKENYAAGMEGGFAADALAQIQRRYFKRFPVELGHFDEPSPEHLTSVDDNAPDPEPEEPDPEKLTPEAYIIAKKEADHRREVIRFRKAQIKRWLAYQYMKDQDLDPKESGANNPFHSLIFAITGKEVGRPRRRTAVNVWRKTQRVTIEARVKELAANQATTKDRLAALRDKVARDIFNNLPASEQEHWKQQATIESDIALEEWKRTILSDPPNAIKDYQLAIQGLVRVSKPFLDFVCKATGWKASLIAGGPEPAQEGKLNVISIHSGTTPGDVKLNWGRAQRTRFKKDVVPCFGDFLKMCYTPEECRARSLSSSEGFQGLVEEECNDEGVDLHQVDSVDPRSPEASTIASNSPITVTNRPHQPLISSTTPLGPCTSHNIPPTSLGTRKAVPSRLGRKGPQYQRVPPVRQNPSDINLSRASIIQATAPFRPPVSAPTQPPTSQALQGAYRLPSSPSTASAPTPSSTSADLIPWGSAALLRDPTPPLSRSQFPVPSQGSTPPLSAPSQAHGQFPLPTYQPQPPDTLPYSLFLPEETALTHTDINTTAVSQTESTEGSTNGRKGKKRGRAKADSAVREMDARPKKKPRVPDIVASVNGSSTHAAGVALLPTATATDGSGLNITNPIPKIGKKKPDKQRLSQPTRRSKRQVGETEQPAAVTTSKLPPKKRRKSTGTWIVSDDEGGWRDQDGNPCDPPSNYKY